LTGQSVTLPFLLSRSVSLYAGSAVEVVLKCFSVFLAFVLGCTSDSNRAEPVSSAPVTGSTASLPSLRDQVQAAKQATVEIRLVLGQGTNVAVVPAGSGVAIGPEAVLTCNHVIATVPTAAAGAPPIVLQGAIVIRDVDRAEDPQAKVAVYTVTGAFTDAKRDLAVLNVPKLNAAPIALASPEGVAVGDDVFVVGHPAAFPIAMEPTISVGTVAARQTHDGLKLLRLDFGVNHGNSGGAVISRSSGKLVGIVDAKVGRLSDALQVFKTSQPSAAIIIGNVDPVGILRQTVTEMDDNLQLGLGLAIRVEEVSSFLATAH
jgi:S1-C subfamily serine protease